jgi:hypothetical protein
MMYGDWDESKFKELVLYIATRCEGDPAFGAIKLNKELFFSDFLSYASHGIPITGAEYIALPHGPAPKVMLAVTSDMEECGDAKTVTRWRFGLEQKRLVPLREPDLDRFSGTEISLVDHVVDACVNSNASELSDLSHRFSGWEIAGLREMIPYESVFLSFTETEDDLEWARRLIAANGARRDW